MRDLWALTSPASSSGRRATGLRRRPVRRSNRTSRPGPPRWTSRRRPTRRSSAIRGRPRAPATRSAPASSCSTTARRRRRSSSFDLHRRDAMAWSGRCARRSRPRPACRARISWSRPRTTTRARTSRSRRAGRRRSSDKIAAAAAEASADMRKVTVGYGEDTIGFNINRRKVIDGKAVVRLNPEGPNDRRVKVLRFDDGRSLTPDGGPDAGGLSPLLLHLGRQRHAALSGRLPQDERRLPGRGPELRREGLRRPARGRCSSRAAPETSGPTCRATRTVAPTRPTSSGPGATSAAPWSALWRGR